jgi:hypothetical protein
LPLWIPRKDVRLQAVVDEHHMDIEMTTTTTIAVQAAEAGMKKVTMITMTRTGEATGAGMTMKMMIVV